VEGEQGARHPRRSNLWFLKHLTQDWAVRTENPHEANLFYMPLFTTHFGGNVGWQQGAAGGRCLQIWS
jgi:hypothetical protein